MTPQEAYVLSRVDGTASESDLALLTGLDAADVKNALERLAQLGAVSLDGASSPRPPPRAVPDESPPAAPTYDPAELDEPADIDLQRKRRILDKFHALENVNHYELLGIERQAEKKVVKAAYYDLVNVFHPDRYFGKNLGSFKGKLERVFARMTEAHDVLTRGGARAEYDRYLASQDNTRELSRGLDDARSVEEVERIEREIAEQAGSSPLLEEASPDSEERTPATSVSSIPPANSPSQPPLDPEARRRALARKLRASIPPPGRASTPAAARETAEHKIQNFKRRVAELKRRRAEHYVQSANEALAAEDLVAASDALKIACSLLPNETSLAARFAELQGQANATLSTSYLEQAQYEEREGRFTEAAQSYERVAKVRPGAKTFERIAFCLLAARGDLKQAVEWGKKAVNAAPEDPTFRVTLGRVYLEVGHRQSALAEFERAATLAPKDDTIKDWLRRAKRSDA